MDPLSHVLLGAATGQAIGGGRRRIAALAGAAGALLPDADVLIASGTDPLLALEYHRQFTHSIVAAPVGAVIVAALLWMLMRRRVEPARLYWPALVGYLSHIFLDACTSYGTQLLWPFTDTRFAASIVAVIDPLITLVLLVGVVLAFRSSAARPARVAVGIVVMYLSVGWIQRERAETLVASAAAQRKHVITQHEVKPTLGNVLLWRSVYQHGNDYFIDAARVGFSAPVLYTGGSIRRIQPIDLVPPLNVNSVQAADLVRFARVSDGFLARHPAVPSVIGDVRYSMLPNSTEPLWGIEVHAEREQEHVGFRTFRDFSKDDRQRFFAMLRGVAPDAILGRSPK